MPKPFPKPLAWVVCLLALAACEPQRAPAPKYAEPAKSGALQWPVWVASYIEEHLAAHPQFAVMQGRHEFDGQLPDWSREGIAREISRLHEARAAALAFEDASMTAEQRFQKRYLVAWIDHDLFWAEKARWPFRNPQFYLGWLNDSLDPSPFITLDYAPKALRLQAFTRYLNNIPRAAEQIQDNLEMPMPLTWLQLGIDAFQGYADYFEADVPAIWNDVEDPKLQSEFVRANTTAVAAMRQLASWLESHRSTATSDFALGSELFKQMLWDTERVDISLADLEAIGRADMQRNLDALRDACGAFAPGASVQDCFQRMSSRKSDDGPVMSARRQLGEIREFMVSEDLVTIPGIEEALVEEAPPYARSNSAYITIPGPWEKDQPSVYYISPPNPEWPEDVQADYIPGEADLLFTSVHEVWPGHFLNFLHAKRSPWIFGRAFVGYAFGEGWAHYTEEMMLEAGLRGADPETRIGQLSNALLRNARFLSSIGLHTQGWSVEASQRFFVEEAYQSEGTAIQQAARGTYDPGYLNYTLGKLLILQLREDWTATRGGRDAWKAFHDRFLSFGGPPIPLVRQAMLDEPEPVARFPGAVRDDRHSGHRLSSWSWDCEDGQRLVLTRVGVEGEGDPRVLFDSQGAHQLEREPVASGVKHAGAGRVFWSKGKEASFENQGLRTSCRLNDFDSEFEDAKLRGADFRALGAGPDWSLELFSAQPSRLLTSSDAHWIEFDAGEAAPLPDGSGSVFSAKRVAQTLVVEVRAGPCEHVSSGHEFETKVRVLHAGRVFVGCGKALH